MNPDSKRDEDADRLDAWLTQGRFTALLGAMLFVTFWPVLMGGQAFFYRDYGFLGYPFAWFHQQAFLAGEFPGWNPLIHCGVPYFAQWNTMVLYPGSLIYVLLPLPWSLAWFCVLHLLLAGVGMYRLGRETTGSPLAAGVGGTAFSFCGMVLGCVIYPNYLVAFGWMPWLLSAAQNAWRGSLKDAVPAALIGTMQMLSGAPELILLTWFLLAALMMGEAVAEKSWLPPLRFGRVVLLIAGLSAFQLLPFVQLLSLSQRSVETATAFWSLPPTGWINFLLPTFACFVSNQNVVIPIGQSFLPSVYLGVITSALAVIGLMERRSREILIFAGCGLIFLLWSFGPAFPPWRWLGELVPIGFARFPVKATLPLAFAGSWLAMHGVVRLRSGSRPWPALVFVGLILLVGVGMERFTPLLAGNAGLVTVNALIRLLVLVLGILFLRHRRWALVAPLLIWADSARHLPVLNPTIDRSAFEPGLAAAYHGDNLKPPALAGGSRVMLSPAAERELHRQAVPKFFDDFIGQRLALWGNLNLLDKVSKVNGAATLTTSWSRDIEVSLYAANAATNHALMDFLGVSHVTAPGELMRWQSRTNPLSLVTGGQRIEVRNGLPPADWNPRETVYLPAPITVRSTNHVTVSIEKVRRDANRIEFTGAADQPSVAVIAETWYPAWHATANGQAVPVHRANHAFMAVPLAKGTNSVVLEYQDKWSVIGGRLTAAVLLLISLIWWRGSRTIDEGTILSESVSNDGSERESE